MPRVNDVDMKWREIFPHVPRPSQDAFIDDLHEAMQEGNVRVVTAPNGFGKTIGLVTLAATMPFDRVYYTSRTHRQAENVIANVKLLNEKNDGCLLTAIELSGKNRTCVNPEILSILDSPDISFSCSMVRKGDFCVTGTDRDGWSRVLDRDQVKPFSFGNVLSTADLMKIARMNSLCPYYLSRAIFRSFRLVACPYNHVFDPSIRAAMDIDTSNSLIICDEAHNIIDAMESFMTKKLSSTMIDGATSITGGSSARAIVVLGKIGEMLRVATGFRGSGKKGGRSNRASTGEFMDFLEAAGFGKEWLKEAAGTLKVNAGTNGFLDQIVSFLYFLAENGSAGNRDVFVTRTGTGSRKGIALKVTTMDIAPALSSLLATGARIVFVSGTLSPGFFKKRLGIDDAPVMEYTLPRRNLEVYVSDDVPGTSKCLSSYYQSRGDGEILAAHGKHVSSVIEHVPGGSIVFFPSYDYRDAAWAEWQVDGTASYSTTGPCLVTPDGIEIPVFREQRDRGKKSVSRYKEAVKNEGKAVLLSVFRGTASEGEDFPGDQCRAVFCVGLPLRNVESRDVTYKMDYHESKRAGTGTFWLTWDAMTVVNQSIGRGIRDPVNDKAIAVLLDTRYRKNTYRRYLCKWIGDCIVENGQRGNPGFIARKAKRFFSTG
jgi:chromosome transmission fidelity protein 1